MQLEDILNSLTALGVAITGGVLGYITSNRNNKSAETLQAREIQGASWEPFFDQAQEFWESLLQDRDRRIAYLEEEAARDSRFRRYVDYNVIEQRKHANAHETTIPKIYTFTEWKDQGEPDT